MLLLWSSSQVLFDVGVHLKCTIHELAFKLLDVFILEVVREEPVQDGLEDSNHGVIGKNFKQQIGKKEQGVMRCQVYALVQ